MKPYKNKVINIPASLIGFHNPRKHTGLSPELFLLTYLGRQAQLIVRGNKLAEQRAGLVVSVLNEWEYWIGKVKEWFPYTLSNEI